MTDADYREEAWKIIPETNGDYEVSNCGRVRNRNTGHIRKYMKYPNGYLAVRYHLNGKNKMRYVHRLVADAFCDHPDGCDVVNHIDNNKENNCAWNLQWTTQFENVHHGMRQKRYRLNAIPVIGYKDGKEYHFVSMHHARVVTGCDDRGIARCCEGIYKTSKGYRWAYEGVT